MIDNSKVRKLPEPTQLMFVWCLLLHKEGRLVGKTAEEIAYAVRLEKKTVEKRLAELKKGERPLLGPDLTPVGWDEWQTQQEKSTGRVRECRERKKLALQQGETTPKQGVSLLQQDETGETVSGNSTETCNAIEEKRREEKSREEVSLPAVRRLLGELRAIGPEWEGLTELQLLPIFQGYPGADWVEVVQALRMDYGGGGAVPRFSNTQKEIRKYASQSEVRQEKGDGAKKQRPPWAGEVDPIDEAREHTRKLAIEAARKKGGGL